MQISNMPAKLRSIDDLSYKAYNKYYSNQFAFK